MDKPDNKTELTLTEKMVLLALDNKGWFGSSENSIKFGLTGAILFELVILGRLELKDNIVCVINPDPTGDVLLDRIFNHIKSSKKTRSYRGWIQNIVYKKMLIRKTILKSLIEKKVIKKEEFSLLWVFYQFKYPILDAGIKESIRQDLYEKIMKGGPLSDEDAMFIIVMDTCKMVRKNFLQFDNYIKVRRRIKEITAFDNPKTDRECLLKILHYSINRAIVASNVSIHA
jgi:golgi phosphoprotein 3